MVYPEHQVGRTFEKGPGLVPLFAALEPWQRMVDEETS
jgi:hypothetical protein